MDRKLEPISKVLADVVGDIATASENNGCLPGVTTGFPELDRAITGLNNSDLIILASRPGAGKTGMALSIARHAAATSGKAVAVFSLDMPRERLALRLLSRECYISEQKLQAGCELSPGDWRKIRAAAASLGDAALFIDDDASTVAEMCAKCRLAENLGLVVIDFLQLIRGNYGDDTGGMLKVMAKELDVPVLCLSQLPRAGERRRNKRPRLSDLQKYGDIAGRADVVLGLYREELYDADAASRGVAECFILKNRRGDTGVVGVTC
jgi:replicative DNA helicase